jgi:acetyltransferase-like isoleucine patch superfamily enzyme
MLMRILMALERAWQQWRTRHIFSRVQCNHARLVLGPELMRSFEIRFPERLSIGEDTVINGDCFINALGGVAIGHHCHIARGLTIYSHNHNWRSKEFIPYDDKEIPKGVKIGDAVWICANVTIAPGVTVGSGAILAAGAVVFDNIPDCAIVRGNPAQVVSYRDQETFERLQAEGKFC